MPANLPPAYHEAEARFRSARTPQEKVDALEEMLRVIPKHKGTEKLQASLKSRIARLRQTPKQKGGARARGPHVPREGAGQIALVGPPNTGKSALVACLTHAKPEVAAYPFTTREAVPGMMPFEDVAVQLVDLPPISPEHVEPWVYDLIRPADLLWIVVEQAGSLEGLEQTRRLLSARHIEPVPYGTSGTGDSTAGGATRKPSLLVVTGLDRPESAGNLELLGELLEEPWPLLAVSTVDGKGLEDLRRRSFDALELIRVYTKKPGKPADHAQPYTLRRGATVADLAEAIHKDLVAQLRFARVWGPSAFDGQTVQREHVLADGDVVEIHL